MNIIFTNTSTDLSRVRLKAIKFLCIRMTIYFEYATKINFPIAKREVKEEFPFFNCCFNWSVSKIVYFMKHLEENFNKYNEVVAK